MKIWILSDLHLEVAPLPEPLAIPKADICVVAGDLCRGVANGVPLAGGIHRTRHALRLRRWEPRTRSERVRRKCSNDPVCADHDPSVAGDERSLIGAACHACALVPETSCESRNNFLDRTLLVDTVAGANAHFFR